MVILLYRFDINFILYISLDENGKCLWIRIFRLNGGTKFQSVTFV